MSPDALFWLLYAFYLGSFSWDFYLTFRQYRVYRDNKKRPENVKDIIGEEDYEKARNYKLDKMHFNFFTMAYGKAETTLILFCQLLPWFWALSGKMGVRMWPGSGEIFQSIIFIGLTSLLETVTSLPFSYYDTFHIEQKHGFNKETLPFFLKDRLKKMLVSLAIATPIVAAIVWIVRAAGPNFPVFVWAFVSIIIFVLMFVYPEFIAPLFDKYTPLPDSELRTKIEQLAGRVAFPLTKIYVVEGSKRSSHSNAYMYGFWKNKRIVLYDTLLSPEMNQRLKGAETDDKKTAEEEGKTAEEKPEAEEKKPHSEEEEATLIKEEEKSKEEEKPKEEERKKLGMADDEVVAVLGHELGHWKECHSIWLLAVTEVNMLLMLFVFSFFYRQDRLFVAFGFPSGVQPVLIGLLLVGQYVLGPYNELLSAALSFVSRRFEFAADRFAANLGFTAQLKTGLIKLGKDNLSLPIDDWLYSACNHSHPPIAERIEALKKFE